MNEDFLIRKFLLQLLGNSQAHMGFTEAVARFPSEFINSKAPRVSYTPWHLLEHIRITQWDILDFIRNPHYQSISWPKDYWPAQNKITNWAGWRKTINLFKHDLAELENIVRNPETNLFSKIPHADDDKYTVFREILLAADHNAYHIGEFGLMRQVMDTWPEDRK